MKIHPLKHICYVLELMKSINTNYRILARNLDELKKLSDYLIDISIHTTSKKIEITKIISQL